MVDPCPERERRARKPRDDRARWRIGDVRHCDGHPYAGRDDYEHTCCTGPDECRRRSEADDACSG